jgi:hypothetical protein
MTWRSWWDDGPVSPSAIRWNVQAWPAIYVLDREGVTRYKWNESPGPESLERAIEDLLR